MSDEVPHQYGHHESKVEEPIAPVKVEECETEAPPAVESTDRGLFDFLSKKKEEKVEEPSCGKEEDKFVADFEDKVKVSEEPKYEEPIVEEKKHESLLQKLHRSDSSSSSSSDEDEVDEHGEKKKKKKGLKEKIKEKVEKKEDTSVPIEKCDEPVEEKKGLIEKIKDKLPGKKTEEVHAPVEHPHPAHVVECAPPVEEKKGFLEKIKDKIPGLHSKTEEEKEKEKEHKEATY